MNALCIAPDSPKQACNYQFKSTKDFHDKLSKYIALKTAKILNRNQRKALCKGLLSGILVGGIGPRDRGPFPLLRFLGIPYSIPRDSLYIPKESMKGLFKGKLGNCKSGKQEQ